MVWGVQVRLAIPDIHEVIDRAVAVTAAQNPSTSAMQQDKGYVRQHEAEDGYSAGTAASVVVTDATARVASFFVFI